MRVNYAKIKVYTIITAFTLHSFIERGPYIRDLKKILHQTSAAAAFCIANASILADVIKNMTGGGGIFIFLRSFEGGILPAKIHLCCVEILYFFFLFYSTGKFFSLNSELENAI